MNAISSRQAPRSIVTPIVALDYPDAESALRLVSLLGDACRFYKIGSELFTACGPSVVDAVRHHGCDVFLDLKLHDIPNTVAGAMRRIRSMDVRIATVHASGGRAMMEAAVDAAGESCGVFAVTILTSLDDGSLGEIIGEVNADMRASVVRLSELARDSGARGLVCSGDEVAQLRSRFGGTLELIVPGIRLAGDASGDQSRVVTPEAAVRAGADYLVLGRSVTAASDPMAAMQSVREQLSAAVR